MKGLFRTSIVVFAAILFSSNSGAQDLNGSWTDKEAKTEFWIEETDSSLTVTTFTGNTFSGVREGDQLNLLFKYGSLEEISSRISPETRLQMLKDGIVMKGAVEKSPLNADIIRLTYYNPVYSRGKKIRDSLSYYVLTKTPLRFENKNGKPIQLVTDISHPYPVITIDEISAGQVSLSKGIATFTISGQVHDAIADMVKDKADIKKVVLGYIDPESENEEEDEDQMEISLNKQASADGEDPWRPFPFEGRFSKQVSIPVWPGEVSVTVSATNIAGNTGYDGFTLTIDDDQTRVIAIKHQENTDPGFFNPVMIKVYDPSPLNPEGEELPEVVLMNGKKIGLRALPEEGSGAFRSELPIIALSKPVMGIENILNPFAEDASDTIAYRNYSEPFYWSYTEHSPPNYYTYAGGTTVKHHLRSALFRKWKIESAVVTYDDGKKDDRYINVTVDSTLPPSNGNEPGYVLKLQIRDLAGLIGNEKKTFRFTLKEKNSTRRVVAHENFIGAFSTTYRLKLVILTFDGLAYHALDSLIRNPGAASSIPTFKKVFQGGYNMDRPALSALPTITWCNWPGIFAMQPPGLHGVIGNAFFGREIAGKEPYAIGGHGTTDEKIAQVLKGRGTAYDGKLASSGGLMNAAKGNSGSLYDNLGASFHMGNAKLNVISVHQWYSKTTSGKVSVSNFYYPNWWKYGTKRLLRFTEHSEKAARLMDRISGKLAAEQFEQRLHHFDVLTVYFPGADNIAHAIGQSPNDLTGNYPAGPKIPNDSIPLYAIKQHLIWHSDRNLNRLISRIEDRGYLYATLFAITGDHGLHAFQNTSDFNLTLYKKDRQDVGGMKPLFESLGFNVWEIDSTVITPDGQVVTLGEKINQQSLVYAPNGGMGQIYLRSAGKTWQQPPLQSDIDKVVARLYIEAVTGGYRNPVSGRPGSYPQKLLYQKFWSKSNPSLGGSDFGALGKPPALFVKENFTADFKWVKFVDTTLAVQYGTLQEFINARKSITDARGNLLYPGFDWPEFIQRMNEMNDKNPGGSRTGDIVFFTDGYTGYMSINNGDELNGWHGGPSRSESYIPLFFNIPGNVVDETFISNAVNAAYREVQPQRNSLRNWDLGRVLVKIYDGLYK